MTNPQAVVLMSGGVDSSTVAYWMKSKGYDVVGLSILYGQRARREVKCALKVGEALGVISHTVLDLNVLKRVFVSPLTRGKDTVKVEENDREGPSYYIVPLRNLVFMSVACAFAESLGVSVVVIGAHQDDCKGFPDCTPEFYRSLTETVRVGTGASATPPDLVLPWSGVPKRDIVKVGLELGVPFQLTWSCYLNGDRPCGKCESCVYRANAFAVVGAPDPLVTKK
jgi:7-cyano-7-deazaguanine synthase